MSVILHMFFSSLVVMIYSVLLNESMHVSMFVFDCTVMLIVLLSIVVLFVGVCGVYVALVIVV